MNLFSKHQPQLQKLYPSLPQIYKQANRRSDFDVTCTVDQFIVRFCQVYQTIWKEFFLLVFCAMKSANEQNSITWCERVFSETRDWYLPAAARFAFCFRVTTN